MSEAMQQQDVIIQDVTARVRTVDGQHLLSPQAMQAIVRAVLMAIDDKQRAEARHRQDTGTAESGEGGQ